MLEESANAETLVPHIYEIIQIHGQKDRNINSQLLWEPHVMCTFIVSCLSHPEIVFLLLRL
jgi:hypothetical protein